MENSAWELMGRALRDYWNGNPKATLLTYSDYAGVEEYPAHLFFREEKELPDLEQYALSICRGRVLDVGAGAGCHSLILQRNNLSVTALDISAAAVGVMAERGVANTACRDIREFRDEPFDTVLMLMNGIGMTEDLAGLRRFLREIRRLVQPDGQLLMDSADLRDLAETSREQHQNAKQDAAYFGIVTYRFEYRGVTSGPFRWLYLDQRTLRRNAAVCGWDCQIIYQEGSQYLARLTRRE